VGTLKPRKHEQRLLRNMGVHKVVLDLLQIPFDTKEDVRMNELMQLAHRFLQNFCLGNQSNQVGSPYLPTWMALSDYLNGFLCSCSYSAF
jgi:hypothetical protein